MILQSYGFFVRYTENSQEMLSYIEEQIQRSEQEYKGSSQLYKLNGSTKLNKYRTGYSIYNKNYYLCCILNIALLIRCQQQAVYDAEVIL